MLRTSDYTIYVDVPKVDGDVLLIHGYTAAYDRVSAKVAGYLKARQRHRPEAETVAGSSAVAPDPTWSPSDETIGILKKRGYLTDKTSEEEQAFVAKLAGNLNLSHQRRMPGYVIMPTYDCNLRCHYCFQDDVRSAGAANGSLRVMDKATIDRLFIAFQKIEARKEANQDGKQRRTYTLFGGEPLHKATVSAISYIIEKGRAFGPAVFSAVSNCTEIEHFEEFLGPNCIRSIQVTFDGPPSEHDRRRVYGDGSGSFAKIAENITMALGKGVEISGRINVDRKNEPGLRELAEEFERRGWTKMRNFKTYTAAIHGMKDKQLQLSSWGLHRSIKRLHAQEEGARMISAPNDSIKNVLREILQRKTNPLRAMRANYCSAHTTMYVFDAMGRIFACWERTGSDADAIGHITAEGEPIFNEEMEQMWRGRTSMSNATCKACPYVLSCGGGCVSLARKAHGSYLDNYCDGFQQRFRAFAADVFTEIAEGRPPEKTTAICP